MNNYKIIKANNGEEALNKLEMNGNIPDLILLDVMMPKMNGFQVCEKIREKYPANQLPIIMLTVKNQTSDIIEGFNSGANDYITKPFSKNELLARIKTHIELSKINIAYGRFIPYEFLNLLNKQSILDVRLGDHIQKNMTVMFSDIRSFMSLSETMTPKENFDFLNSFLKRVAPIIRAKNGFIDKYIGDAVMALFPENPDDALDSAIEIQKEVINYNNQQGKMDKKHLRIGIGLHTGSLILGTIGEDERMDETVISDAVNLSSRLEGLTKAFGASIIISKDTLIKLTDLSKYNYRFLGKAQVKGRVKPIPIFEVFDGNPDEIIEKKKNSLDDFDKALDFYFQKKFENAKEIFKNIIKQNPKDTVASLYYSRCKYYETNKPSENWEGVETFLEK
jgi:two-component system sensor histidine kinase ChiS